MSIVTKISGLQNRISEIEDNFSAFEAETTTNIKELNDRLPTMKVYGDTEGMSKDDAKTLFAKYSNGTESFSGYCTLKWQGSSSLAYDKKNYTISFYLDGDGENKNTHEFKNGWGNQSKYVLKANYIDYTHARNICSAMLWADIVKTRKNVDSNIAKTPNYCAIDGFPVKLYINDQYKGLYTLNIPKDGWMFGMDKKNPNHAVLCAEQNNNGDNTKRNSSEFRKLANIDESDWSLEFPKELNPDIKTSFNNLISFVMNSTDTEFKESISDYLDLESAIDYWIFCYFILASDSLGKNQIFMTYDGIHWIASMYDMDSVFGLAWNGYSYLPSNTACPSGYQETNNLLWERISSLYADEIKVRYNELRKTALDVNYIAAVFKDFDKLIPDYIRRMDVGIYGWVPQYETNTVSRIIEFIRNRAVYCDEMFG